MKYILYQPFEITKIYSTNSIKYTHFCVEAKFGTRFQIISISTKTIQLHIEYKKIRKYYENTNTSLTLYIMFRFSVFYLSH